MTAKEKAKELVNKFYSLITGMEVSYISKLIYLPSGDSNYEIARLCARIAAESVLNSFDTSYPYKKQTEAMEWTTDDTWLFGLHKEYWQEVIIEIDKIK